MTRETAAFIPIDDAFVFPSTVHKIKAHPLVDYLQKDTFFSEDPFAVLSLAKMPLADDLQVNELTQTMVHEIGVKVELIRQHLDQEGRNIILVEGLERVQIHKLHIKEDRVECEWSPIPTIHGDEEKVQQLAKKLYDCFKEHLDLLGETAPETLLAVLDVSNAEEMVDLMTSFLRISPEEKQEVLQEIELINRIERLQHSLNEQIIDANLNRNIDSEIDTQVDQERRTNLLKSKLRAIQNELNQNEIDEADLYQRQLDELHLDDMSVHEIEREIQKLRKVGAQSQEAAVIRNYLDFVFGLPWHEQIDTGFDMNQVQKDLNAYHYGLEEIKERILEQLAVRQLASKAPRTILCLAGPPGVGKTSIVKSVAKAMKRPFFRIALGGLKDEADLRGHRRTYVGAMPGRIVSALYKTKSFAPVILLDEIDKMAAGFKGDPSSILLEVLDPEQNDSFNDHYMQIPIDLSEAVFICTANDLEQIPAPLLNRLETLEIPGYSSDDKLDLTQQYLVPKLQVQNGITQEDISIPKKTIQYIIEHYTTDVGLRQLERHFQAIYRKVALKKLRGDYIPRSLKQGDVSAFLGQPIPKPSLSKEPVVGRSVALYSMGMVGQILPIEVVILKGTGRVISTGNIDPLLRETLLTVLSQIKHNATQFKIDEDSFSLHDFHIHFRKPELLKKGEGWGLAIFAAILSAILEIPLSPKTAFAAQVSLLGQALPTRDIEQKLLAASQLGIETVVASKWNFDDKSLFIPPEITVIQVDQLADMLDILIAQSQA